MLGIDPSLLDARLEATAEQESDKRDEYQLSHTVIASSSVSSIFYRSYSRRFSTT
jgi:hypothetical protein